jgi:hypothetical protein
MQHGDLETSSRRRIVVVLEGVLATITPIVQPHRWPRHDEVTGYHFLWHDIPLKRLATMKRNHPQTAIDVITFVSDDVIDQAAQFFLDIHLPVDSVAFERLDQYADVLRYQADIVMVIDSDDERLDKYGQLGKSVLIGGDF